jgi:hypothetical protein
LQGRFASSRSWAVELAADGLSINDADFVQLWAVNDA